MLGYAALQLLPFGTPAARVTFVSVLSSAGAGALIYFTLVHLFRTLSNRERSGTDGVTDGTSYDTAEGCDKDEDGVDDARASAVIGAGVYSFSPLVWTYSTQAEVFALNNLFVAALIFLTTRYLVPLPLEQTETIRGTEMDTGADKVPPPKLRPASHCPAPSVPTILSWQQTNRKSRGCSLEGCAVSLRNALVDLNMTEHRLSQEDVRGERTLGGFYWSSTNLSSCETLMMIIPGSGSSQGGLWSTLDLCEKAGPHVGSVVPYLQRAQNLGWGTLLLCPNAHFQPRANVSGTHVEAHKEEEGAMGRDASIAAAVRKAQAVGTSGVVLSGSASAEQHAVSVWEEVVRKCAGRVLIVAHSTGGIAALHAAACFPSEFAARVRGMALLDSVHTQIGTSDVGVCDLCRTCACNFVASSAPLGGALPKPWHTKAPVVAAGCLCRSGGHTDHLHVPAAAMSAAFDFLNSTLAHNTSGTSSSPAVASSGGCGGGSREGSKKAERGKWSKDAGDSEEAARRPAEWIPYAGAWLIGVGLTNQHTLVLVALPLALSILLAGRHSLLRPGALLTLVGCGMMGLVPYLYLVTAGEQPQRGAWGDPAGVVGLVVHVLRQEYGTWKLFSGNEGQKQGLESLTTGTSLYLQQLPQEQMLVGPLLVLVGAWRLLLSPPTRTLAATLVLAWVGYTLIFHSLANLPLAHTSHGKLFRSVHARFWLQPNTILAIFLGVGVLPVMRMAAAAAPSVQTRPMACWTLATFVIGLQILLNFAECDKSHEWAVWEAGHATLLSVPLGGLLLIKGDLNTNAVRYMMECEGARPDVEQLDLSHVSYTWFNRRHARAWYSNVTLPGRRFTRLHRKPPKGAYLLRHLLKTNFRRRPIVITSGLESLDPEILQDFVLWPSGSAFRIYPRNEPPPLRPWLRDNGMRLPVLSSNFIAAPAGSGLWEDVAIRDAAIAHAQVASHMLVNPPPATPAPASASASPSSSSSSAPAGQHADGTQGAGCRVVIAPDKRDAGSGADGVGHAGDGASQSSRGVLPICSTLEGWEIAEGEKCNLVFLQACRGILEGVGDIDRLSWFSCAAQALICIASSMAEPPPLIWKNAAAAMEQILIQLGDPLKQDYESHEATKMMALSRYATAEICKSKTPVAEGDAELALVLDMLADAGMPVTCRG